MTTRYFLACAVSTAICFMGLYVNATMNAIGDSYQLGLDNFKYPFRVLIIVVLVTSISWVVLALLSKSLRLLSKIYMRAFGLGLCLAAGLVFTLGFAPCLNPHPTEEETETHHYCLLYTSPSPRDS